MIDVNVCLTEAEEKMDMAIMYLDESLAHIRAGKANTRILDGIRVDSYGSMVPLNNVAAISTPDARTIAIKPWDKSMFRVIEKAIIDSDLGITPDNNGEIIRLGIPPLTEERRKDLSKDVKKKGDAAKVAIRNIRRDANDTFKKMNKANELTEDDQKTAEQKMQKLTDKYIEKVDKEVEAKTSIPRYRLGSLNPLEITPEMLDFLQDSKKFCPHFHLSLQSACNPTLKRMNRHYTVEYYLDQIEDIVSRFNNPFLGSDIIAGFVGETDEDFETTVENLKKSKLSQIHTFPYSIRKGTIAEKLQGHLPDNVREERANIIKQISAEKFNKFLNSNIGSEQEILIEKRLDKKTGLYKGVTRNYINVLLKEGNFNTLKNVTLNEDNIVRTMHLC